MEVGISNWQTDMGGWLRGTGVQRPSHDNEHPKRFHLQGLNHVSTPKN
jgi:hypothetical protein